MINKMPNIVFMILTMFVLADTVQADEMTEMRHELDALKREITVLQTHLEDIEAADSNIITISGYTDLEYSNSSKAGSEPGFRLHHLSLFFEKQISDQWKFFSEIEYEDAPFNEFEFVDTSTDSACDGCSGKIFVEAVNFTQSLHKS